MDSKLKSAVAVIRVMRKRVKDSAFLSTEELNAFIPLLDLAESVLAIAGKVPQRYSEQELEGLAGDSHLMATSRNDLIDQCTLAFAGMIPDNKQFGEEYDQNSNCDSNYVYGWNACRDAILSAMKGGGK
jgi:dsDNA-binding SOS-regulon protein